MPNTFGSSRSTVDLFHQKGGSTLDSTNWWSIPNLSLVGLEKITHHATHYKEKTFSSIVFSRDRPPRVGASLAAPCAVASARLPCPALRRGPIACVLWPQRHERLAARRGPTGRAPGCTRPPHAWLLPSPSRPEEAAREILFFFLHFTP